MGAARHAGRVRLCLLGDGAAGRCPLRRRTAEFRPLWQRLYHRADGQSDLGQYRRLLVRRLRVLARSAGACGDLGLKLGDRIGLIDRRHRSGWRCWIFRRHRVFRCR